MMDWGGDWGAAGSLAMTVGMTAVALLVVAGVFLLIRPVFGRPEYSRPEPDRAAVTQANSGLTQGDSGLEVLNGRYARGEIAREEYLERRRDLVGLSSGAAPTNSVEPADGSSNR
jgi:uncharacterized membrane protein